MGGRDMKVTGRIAVVALVVGALAAGASARDQGELPAPRPPAAQEVTVVAVLVDPTTHQPAIVLEGKRDKRQLAMSIGVAEATGIAVPLQGITPPRPLTHDLFLTMFGRLHVALTRVVVHDFRDNIYFATVHLTANGTAMTLDARPSDAIALALRAKVPVLVEDRVFERGGLPDTPGRPSKPSV
jgi:bifunctional DNase/RNase